MAHLALPLHTTVGFFEIDAQSSAVEKKPSPNVKVNSTETTFTETDHTELVKQPLLEEQRGWERE